MPTRTRSTALISFLLGSLTVGVVVLALAVAGVFGSRDDGGAASTATPSAPSAPISAGARPTDVADIYQQVSPGVVFVSARGGDGALPFQGPGGGEAASGSGFLINRDGYVVTNDHVVEGASQYAVRFGEDGKAIEAKLVGADPSTDIALLKLDPSKLPDDARPLALGDSSGLRPGVPAIAIGSPFGLEGTVTTGIVSALDRKIQSPNGFEISGVVQTDAAINPGNSGGPLLDSEGRVIGINSQIATGGSSSANSGVGFAVPVNTVKQVVPELRKDGKIDRAWLGVATAEAPTGGGAVVADVTQGGPAARAGLRQGDRIVSLDGRKVRTSSDLGLIVLGSKPGDTIKLEFERGGDTRTLTVKLGTRPDQSSQSQQQPQPQPQP
jgi:putative serine protease PepD